MMKLSKFKEMLAMVGAIIKTNGSSVNRCSIPSFFGVLIEIDDKKLRITGAGIGGERITIAHDFGDESVAHGKTMICYTALSRLISSRVFKDGDISVSFGKAKGAGDFCSELVITQEDELNIDSPAKAKIPLFEYADNTDLSHMINPMTKDARRLRMTFNRQQLAQSLKFVVPFSAKSDIRYYLCAACLNVRVNKRDMALAVGTYFNLKASIEAVATDGHRMGFQRLEAEVNHFDTEDHSEAMRANLVSDAGENVLLPRVMAGNLAEWLSKKNCGDQVVFDYGVKGDADFDFTTNGLHVRLRMASIDGKYPDYRRVFCKPELNKATITVRRAAIERQLRMLNALYFDRARYFGVKLAAKDGFLTISAPQDKEKLNALAIPYEAELHDTKVMVNWIAGLNLNYLLDVIVSEKNKDFSMRIAPNNIDSRVSVECKALNGFCIIMPIRI